mgnify:FL=1
MRGAWPVFSNYGPVLVCRSSNNEARVRDVAQEVGITERAEQKIVRDLQTAGYITIRKQGRCNRYRINRRKAMRHALESHVTVGKLLTLIAATGRIALAENEAETPVEKPPSQASGPRAEPLPATQAGPETVTEAPVKPDKPETAPDDEPAAPVDVRQQGSLF